MIVPCLFSLSILRSRNKYFLQRLQYDSSLYSLQLYVEFEEQKKLVMWVSSKTLCKGLASLWEYRRSYFWSLKSSYLCFSWPVMYVCKS